MCRQCVHYSQSGHIKLVCTKQVLVAAAHAWSPYGLRGRHGIRCMACTKAKAIISTHAGSSLIHHQVMPTMAIQNCSMSPVMPYAAEPTQEHCCYTLISNAVPHLIMDHCAVFTRRLLQHCSHCSSQAATQLQALAQLACHGHLQQKTQAQSWLRRGVYAAFQGPPLMSDVECCSVMIRVVWQLGTFSGRLLQPVSPAIPQLLEPCAALWHLLGCRTWQKASMNDLHRHVHQVAFFNSPQQSSNMPCPLCNAA